MRIITSNSSWSLASTSSNVAFQVTGAHPVEIARSANDNIISGFIYAPQYGDRGAISDLFPDSSGANLYVRSATASTVVFG
jgi:hypothetical protein